MPIPERLPLSKGLITRLRERVTRLFANFSGSPSSLQPFPGDQTETLWDKLIGSIVELVGQFGASGAHGVPTVAALRALDTSVVQNGAIITVAGYWSAGDGGGGSYRIDTSDTSSADDGGSVIVLTNGIRAKAIFDDENINVRRFGAKVDGATDDNAAVQAARAYQQNTSGKAKTLFFPAGVCLITATLQASTRPLYINGVGCSMNANSGTSVIRMLTDNIPIVRYTLDNERVSNVHLTFVNYQVAANTNAIGIRYAHGSYKSCTRGVAISRTAYGLYFAEGEDAWQHSVWDSYVNGFSISGVYLNGNGTEWSIGNIYVQNLVSPPGTNMQGQILSAVRTGAQVAYTMATLPTNIAVNRYVQIFGVDSFFDKIAVVKTLVGNVVTVDYTSDPGYNPPITASSKLQFAAQLCTKEAFRLGYGMRASLHAIDVEHVVTSGPYMLSLVGQSLAFDKLYLEQLYSNAANHRFILHDVGNLTIDSMEMANHGCLPGQPGLIFHEGSTSINGSITVGSFSMRDIAYNGSTLTFCTKTGAGPDLQVDYIAKATTFRANASSSFTSFGNVKTPRTRPQDTLTTIGASGSVATYPETAIINQSGTAGYIGWDYYITQTAVGSGYKAAQRVIVDGGTVYQLFPDGGVSLAGALTVTGSLVSISGNQARVNAITDTATTSTFGGAVSTESSVRLNYGAAVDRQMDISGNNFQTSFRSTGAAANMVINAAGGNVTLGNGVAGTGLVVGNAVGTVVSRLRHGRATLVGGTVTVSDANVTANTRITVGRYTRGGVLGDLDTETRSAGVSFTIRSSSALETSVIDWVSFEP